MVNCKNCGAPLSLEDAVCPHCGTPNPEAQEHLKKLKDLGYERAELIPTDNGKFMSPWEAKWMALSGSALLVGKK